MSPNEAADATADLPDTRADYTLGELTEDVAGDDPIALFRRWYADVAAATNVVEANAFVLATVGPDGVPAARTVLLKGIADDGFTFFTNTDSAKGRDLAAHPFCALTFGWYALQRQVRVTGVAKPVSREAAEGYFASRPRDSQLGAWASVAAGGQSAPVADRGVLDTALAEVTRQFPDHVPCPPNWGGYLVRPASIEFWQGRHGRLHDRLVFVREQDSWTTQRLAP